MARTLKIIESQYLNSVVVNGVTTNGFLDQVDDYLATLVNPIVRSWSVDARFVEKRQNIQWTFMIETDTGGAALATPFTLRVDQQTTALAMANALTAFFAIYAGFPSGGKLIKLDSDVQGYAKQFVMAHLLNATAGASANYLPL